MALQRWARLAVLMPLCLLSTACALPRVGALSSEIERSTAAGGVAVVPIDEAFALGNRTRSHAALPPEIRLLPPMAIDRITAGDQLGITIFEGSSPTVPSAIGGRLELSRVDVAGDGTIGVPFAGNMMVGGKPVDLVRQEIETRLRRKLYDPQVQIRLLESTAKSVSVVGFVRKGGSFALTSGLTRLTDLIGAAGVEAEWPEQVTIELRRDGNAYPLNLKSLLSNPLDNVALRPGDVISVQRNTGFVTLMGAVATPSRIAIAGENYSVLDALAEARGLDGRNADPSGIYLFPAADRSAQGGRVVVYSIDIRDPKQVMLARQLRLVDGDLVYVSTASFAQTAKVLDSISRALLPLSRIPVL
jgi:polysaccharide export outer membrane protein